MRCWLQRLRSERGQAIILFVGVLTVIFVIGAIVIDWGLWLSERRGVQRAADLAALAGSQDLPSDGDAARVSALDWAARNGYEDGVDGVEVEVELLCSNKMTNPPRGICRNPNPSSDEPSPCSPEVGCDSLRVVITKPGRHLFSSIFGISGMHVGFGAVAALSFDVMPLDTALMLDATGSMGDSPCNGSQSNPGCPIKEAKDAANDFVDILLPEDDPSGVTQVAFAPYRGCYNPPRTRLECVPGARIVGLTNDPDPLHAGISGTTAQSGSGTNVCLALWEGQQLLSGSTAERRFVVILTDGDNNYNSITYGQGHPPVACRPINPSSSSATGGCSPSSPNGQEADLAAKTLAVADQLMADDVEIFVVGFGVCGGADSAQAKTPGYCNAVGRRDHDNEADRRLLKCIASSTEGTNDHYFEVERAEDLPEVFQIVAWEIAGRALTQ